MELNTNKKLWHEGSFIGGRTHTERTSFDDQIQVFDKYTHESLAEIPLLPEKAYEKIPESASKAFDELSQMAGEQRRELLENLQDLVAKNRRELVRTIVAEAGKPVSYANVELDRALSTLQFAIEESTRIKGEVIPMDFAKGKGREAYTKPFPIGPIVGISPFNFPLNLVLHKLAPALAAGCSLTLKPSPKTPLTALFLAELVKEAGFPAGSFNVLVCSDDMAQRVIEDETFKMFSFTGSAKVGWFLKSKAGKKKVVLELGGNAPCILDDSADIQEAAKLLARGCFLYGGQICLSTQRIIVAESIEKKFIDAFRRQVLELPSGDPSDEKTLNGPLIDKDSFQRVSSWVDEALKEGGELLFGGESFDEKGHIYEPTLIKDPPHHTNIYSAEVFGPVATLETFGSFEEALEMANDTRYGLQAGLFTENLSHMKVAFNQLQYGAVLINNIPGFRLDHMPYGGIKDSGLGREGVTYSMREMMENRLLIY